MNPTPTPYDPPAPEDQRGGDHSRAAELLSLFDTVPDLIARFDPDLRHLCVNRRVEEATGRPAREFVGRTNRDLGMPADLVALWEDRLREAFEAARPVLLDFSYPGPDGLRHYEARLLPEPGPDGRVGSVLGITTDVTDRRRAEVALRASEKRFRLLAEHARDVIFRFEYLPAPRYAYVSPAVHDLTGYAPEEFYADPATGLRLFHPDDRPRMAELMAAPPTAELWFEVRYQTRDGQTVWTEQSVVPVADAGGRLVAVEGVVRDVTARKRAEDELRAAKEEAEAALAQVRQLRGLLPICSYCKKIRDGRDYWHQVEAYLSRHTDARFSHGICPGCFADHVQPQLDELPPRPPG